MFPKPRIYTLGKKRFKPKSELVSDTSIYYSKSITILQPFTVASTKDKNTSGNRVSYNHKDFLILIITYS